MRTCLRDLIARLCQPVPVCGPVSGLGFLGLVALAVMLGTGLSRIASPAGAGTSPSSSPWDATYFTNLPVVSHDGRTFRFYDDLVKDKIVVINFIYTSCSNICPLTTARLAEVKDRLGDAVGRDIFFYSITLDPVMDGPELLKKYAETYKAGPGWLFLTGKPDDIDMIRHKLGERSRSLGEHRNDVILGNGSTGEWGRDSMFSDTDQLVATIRNMDPKWRSIVQPLVAGDSIRSATVISGTPGKGLFIKACAACHTIGQGDLVGPDLAGVRARHDPAWLRRYLLNPDALRAAQDPAAVAIDAKYPGVSMPNLGLSDSDVDDLMVYLEANAPAAPTVPAGPAKTAATSPSP